MHPRLVRYSDLVPCTDAFIDTRTPGSDRKENFTIIGPGVSENPNQHVHIAEPHGFNIGGARQPAGCRNSQHSHDTAEVFFVHSGRWAFRLGEHGEVAEFVLEPGDLISLPTNVFRGFENIGEEIGYLWAVLGGDNPGRVLWAPDVFDLAEEYGLVLLENGNLIDLNKGECVPDGGAPMPRTTKAQIGKLRTLSKDELAGCVSRQAVESAQLLGPRGDIRHETGFSVDRLTLMAGEIIDMGKLSVADVLFLHAGVLDVHWEDQKVRMTTGDTLTIPKNVRREFIAIEPSIFVRVLGE